MVTDGKSSDLLVIKLGALGDVVLALPYVARIQAAWPRHRITVLTAPQYAGLVGLLPGVEVVAFPRKGFVAMSRLSCWLLGRRPAIVFDLQGSLRSRIMTLLSRAGMRVGRRASPAYTHAPAGGHTGVHACDWLNGVLVAGGVGAIDPGWRLPVTQAVRARVRDWLQAHALLRDSLVLLHAGSSPSWPSKRWPAEYFQALSRALAEHGLQVIWLGGAEERDHNRVLAEGTGTDASGEFSYPELAALAEHAVFALTNDSGPMHILAAAGLPVYAFFGPTDWRRSHAPGQADRVLHGQAPCSPCRLRVCPPQRRHICMRELTPEHVIARLQADSMID